MYNIDIKCLQYWFISARVLVRLLF